MDKKFPFPINPEDAGDNFAVGFLSPVAGAGATTLACLTALSLAESNKNVALVDFVGKARVYMGMTVDDCPVSVLDVLGVEQPSKIRSAGVNHPRNLFVIPGAVRPLDVPQITSKLVNKTICYLKNEFDYTIAILPPVYESGWAGAIVCDNISCVFKPDRTDLDICSSILELLIRLGCGGRIKVILNQSKAPGALLEEEVVEILKPDLTIKYDSALRSMCNKRYLNTEQYKKPLLDLVEGGIGHDTKG
jgi:MinD-like ATPase involved in chromosome partitioning or flagellar assembly